QIITYTEWLPALLGPLALPAYTGYKPYVNPSIGNEFSTALFRFGHSQLDNEIDRLNNDGTDISNDPAGASVDLAQAFFNPTLINPAGVTDPFSGHLSTDIDPILKGAASGDAQEVDLLAVRDIRNLMFGPPGAGGSDLIARDIQRGRDHGLTDYNSMRAAYSLPRLTSFAQITSNVPVQQQLQQLYGNVDNIDAFVGALTEDHVPGADVGPLTKAVLVNQFKRLRDGDRFFYLNQQWSQEELNILQQSNTLAKVIENDTIITNLQANVFFFQVRITGTVFYDRNGNGQQDRFDFGIAGFRVELVDGSGAVIASTLTSYSGRYSFDNVNQLGTFTVQVVTPSYLVATTPNPLQVTAPRGQTLTATFGFDLSGWSLWGFWMSDARYVLSAMDG